MSATTGPGRCDLSGCQQDVQGAGVPKQVGRDPLGAKHGTLRARRNGVLVEEIREACARHLAAASIEKELGHLCFSTDSQPRPHRVGDDFPESEDPLLAALAPHTQVHVARAERHVAEAQTHELGGP